MSATEIKALEQQWQKAFNAGDASGVANLYRQDARLLPPNTDIVEGRSEIESYVKEFVQTGAQLKFDVITVHESADMCAVVGKYDMTIPVPGGEPQKDKGKYIEVWTRTDGKWLIADDTFNSSLPVPGT